MLGVCGHELISAWRDHVLHPENGFSYLKTPFLNEAQFPDLAAYTGWSSVKVFLNHYHRELEDMRHSVVAAGTITTAPPRT